MAKEDQVLLQNDLNKLIEWEEKCKMAFNVDKCNVMHITRARTTKKHPYVMHYLAALLWILSIESMFSLGPRRLSCILLLVLLKY
jgi:hypothetical protein